jgi:hypothetical protein
MSSPTGNDIIAAGLSAAKSPSGLDVDEIDAGSGSWSSRFIDAQPFLIGVVHGGPSLLPFVTRCS